MRLIVKNGFIYNEAGVIVMIMADYLSPEVQEEVERVVEFGSEAVPAVEKFIDEVNSGSFKPRSVVKRFEEIANRYK